MICLTYTVLLEPDPDAGGFTVTLPELPGCITQGETREEAMARDAITLHIEGLAADGLNVPVERVAPQLATVDVEIGDAFANRVA